MPSLFKAVKEIEAGDTFDLDEYSSYAVKKVVVGSNQNSFDLSIDIKRKTATNNNGNNRLLASN